MIAIFVNKNHSIIYIRPNQNIENIKYKSYASYGRKLCVRLVVNEVREQFHHMASKAVRILPTAVQTHGVQEGNGSWQTTDIID